MLEKTVQNEENYSQKEYTADGLGQDNTKNSPFISIPNQFQCNAKKVP